MVSALAVDDEMPHWENGIVGWFETTAPIDRVVKVLRPQLDQLDYWAIWNLEQCAEAMPDGPVSLWHHRMKESWIEGALAFCWDGDDDPDDAVDSLRRIWDIQAAFHFADGRILWLAAPDTPTIMLRRLERFDADRKQHYRRRQFKHFGHLAIVSLSYPEQPVCPYGERYVWSPIEDYFDEAA